MRTLRSSEEQIDIVRLNDGQQIAVPRWMLDPVYCAQLPQEKRPRVAIPALLRLSEWLTEQILLRGQSALQPEGSNNMKGQHALRQNPPALSAPAPTWQSLAVGQTARTHASPSAPASDSDTATGRDQLREERRQP